MLAYTAAGARWACRTAHQRSFSVKLGVLKEQSGEKRVSMVPSVAEKLLKQGYTMQVESGAGAASGFSDAAYKSVGCEVVPRATIYDSDITFTVTPPPAEELGKFKDKMVVGWVGRMLPDGKAYVEKAVGAGVSLVDTTAVPRITTAQKLDVLSSQAKIAGHRAVVEASYVYQKFYAGEITAAGKYPPAHTMVLGIGVAGLAAMGTTKALGGVIRAWDVRNVSDQVISMGGKWITVDFKEDGAGAGGYAKESSAEFQAAQKATFHKHAKEVDIIISTAAIPGRKSPVLIEDYMVKDMKPGSVIVDLAAAGGGNCSLTKPGEAYMTDNGVTIIGYLDFPARMGAQASSMYATNMLNLMSHVGGKEGAAAFMDNWNAAFAKGEDGDIIVRSILCSDKGKAVEMPPPPQPTPVAPKKTVEEKKKEVVVDLDAEHRNNALGITGGSAAVLAMSGDPAFMQMFQTFSLAGIAGYQAVFGVTHALHTPLMSVTNAISGLTAVGGLLILGHGGGIAGQGLAHLAVGISSINIVGGFMVSKRMLDLFKRPGEKDYSYYYALPAGMFAISPFAAPAALYSTNTLASMLCISSILGLSSQKTAQLGCMLGIVGVTGATVSAFSVVPGMYMPGAVAMMAAGGAAGGYIGQAVEPMKLPQTVAAFHSLVGAAATFASIASFLAHPDAGAGHRLAAIAGDSIGMITLTGSLIAYAKLDGQMSSKELSLPGKNMINASMLAAQLGMAGMFLSADVTGGAALLVASAGLSGAMGAHLVASVGGGDMPVCVTVLNSYSGWALVAEGFMLNSPTLTVVGSLIGFSGAILTKIMCDGMNRDIFNVIFGGYATAGPVAKGDEGPKEHQETNVDAVANMLAEARKVVVVPGYGLAVARAQYAVGDIAKTCMENSIDVQFAIHPVAGRMPGQMNVLLAEAGVPYEWVLEMEEVNPDIADADVCLVVGANDITNSAAEDLEGCSIYGMPVIQVWKAKTCVFMKRSMAGGYADLENPVFFKENTLMLLGDAKNTCDAMGAKFKEIIAKK
jgi:NAD(P) transhydrogenase